MRHLLIHSTVLGSHRGEGHPGVSAVVNGGLVLYIIQNADLVPKLKQLKQAHDHPSASQTGFTFMLAVKLDHTALDTWMT